jgi:hypothetical protein
MGKIEYLLLIFSIFLYVGVIIYSVGGLIFTSYSEGIYFHNIDMAYNMCLISNDLCEISKEGNCSMNTDYRNWNDRYSLNDTISYSDTYIESNDNMTLNFFQFGYYAFIFGFGICSLIFLSFHFLENWKKECEKNG